MGTFQNGNKSAYHILFKAQSKKIFCEKEQDLDVRLEELDSFLSQNTNADGIQEKQQEYARLKQELSLIYENRGKGTIIRSKARWTEQGEQPTKYFFNLEKWNYNRKVIREIQRTDGEILHEEKDILSYIENFYRDLYTSNRVENTSDSFEAFVENLEIPKLQDKQRDELEGEISLEECKNVLRTFANGKSPGDDRLTWEFYNCFFWLVGTRFN